MFHNVRRAVIIFRRGFKSDTECFVGVVGSNFQQPCPAFDMLKVIAFRVDLFDKSFFEKFKAVHGVSIFLSGKYDSC